MVPEKVKSELKRFLTAKQVEELSKQFQTYEKRVRQAFKHFDLQGREARVQGQKQLDKFAAQVKRTGQQLEKQLKTFVSKEGRQLNQGLNELIVYFRDLAKTPKAGGRGKGTSKKAATSRTSTGRRTRGAKGASKSDSRMATGPAKKMAEVESSSVAH